MSKKKKVKKFTRPWLISWNFIEQIYSSFLINDDYIMSFVEMKLEIKRKWKLGYIEDIFWLVIIRISIKIKKLVNKY